MKKDDILVVKINGEGLLSRDVLQTVMKGVRESIIHQRDNGGVIVLPPYVDVIIAPGDIDIKVEEPEEEMIDCSHFFHTKRRVNIGTKGSK